MSLELSEGFFAGLSLVDTATLEEAKGNKDNFRALYDVAVTNLGGGKVLDGKGNKTKTGMVKGVDKQKMGMDDAGDPIVTEESTKELYDDCAKALSAVLGFRAHTRYGGIPDNVYLTGNKWHSGIASFNIVFEKMKSYNSSDIILQYGKVFVGVSLKKKSSDKAASPPLINNAFSAFLTGEDPTLYTEMRKELNETRIKFFAKVIKDACGPDGPLKGAIECDTIEKNKWDPNTIAGARNIWNIKVERYKTDRKGIPQIDPKTKKIITEKIQLINAKSQEAIVRGDINPRFDQKIKNDFRTYINEKLQSKDGGLNELFAKFLEIMNKEKVKETLASSLLNKTLKLGLLDQIWNYNDESFDFYLVTGIANTNSKGVPTINTGTVIDQHSVIVSMLQLKQLPAKMEVQDSTFTNNAASVDFILYKGDNPILDITLRYGGTFTAFPRFHATATKHFYDLCKASKKIIS